MTRKMVCSVQAAPWSLLYPTWLQAARQESAALPPQAWVPSAPTTCTAQPGMPALLSLPWYPGGHLVRRPMTPWCAKWTCAGSNKFSSGNSADRGSSRWYLDASYESARNNVALR